MSEHLYLHVPFCEHICYYCDFCHQAYSTKAVSEWLKELPKELATYDIPNDLKTIYIGGGTPSALKADELESILELLKPYAGSIREYTVEANPENLTKEKIELLKRYGVNRVSLGVQAIQDRLLKMLNRHHSFEDVKKVIGLLRNEGFDNIAVDLLYALPDQSLKDVTDSVQAMIDLDIPHISLYSLTIEPHSVFGQRGYQKGDDELETDMYEATEKLLDYHRYEHYEIANFAQIGYRSLHNMGYWHYDDFYGISLGASGKLNHHRYDNTRSMEKYLKGEYIENDLPLTVEDEMFEEIMMSFRLVMGLDLERFYNRYHRDFFEVYKKPFEDHKDAFIYQDGFLRVKNRELLNELLVAFMD